MMEFIVIIVAFFIIGAIYFGTYEIKRTIKINSKLPECPPPPPPPPQVNVNMKPVEDAIKALPNKVLQSIQSSVNSKKGALGELIGYIELEAQYDRIIPLGNIVDFVCIKLPTDTEEGRIDFVDIKTGKSARLSKEQRLLQQLIIDKKINFVKLTVNTQTSETISTTN